MRYPLTRYFPRLFLSKALQSIQSPHSHSIVLHRPIVLILGYKIKLISPRHRRLGRHKVCLLNPQQYFFGWVIVRCRHLSTSIVFQLATFAKRTALARPADCESERFRRSFPQIGSGIENIVNEAGEPPLDDLLGFGRDAGQSVP